MARKWRCYHKIFSNKTLWAYPLRIACTEAETKSTLFGFNRRQITASNAHGNFSKKRSFQWGQKWGSTLYAKR